MIKSPFKKPFPSDRFGGLSVDYKWKRPEAISVLDGGPIEDPSFKAPDNSGDWYSVTMHFVEDVSSAAFVWWRRKSENPTMPRGKGGAK